MPRKPQQKGDHYYDPFPSRLRELIEERNLIQDDLTEILGVKSRQSVTGYIDGSTAPTAEKIVAIARAFQVSSDWLLGLTEVPAQNPSMRDIEKYTHLSSASVDFLGRPKKEETRKALDLLLSAKELPELLQHLSDVERAVVNANRTYLYLKLPEDDRKKSLAHHKDRLAFSVFRLTLSATALCNELFHVEEMERKLSSDMADNEGIAREKEADNG